MTEEEKQNLKEAFLKVYAKIPKGEMIMPVCPIDLRVYSWADVKTAIENGMAIADKMCRKLRELDII